MSFSQLELNKIASEQKQEEMRKFRVGASLADDDESERGRFIRAMLNIQDKRTEVVGGHTWQEAVETYGPRLMYAEIASINTRLKRIFWDGEDIPTEENLRRAEDLLVDLANYASFLHQWIQVELHD